MNVCVSTRNNVNLNDSASSSDAADVLIRSTKVLVEQMNDRRSAAPGRSDVNIYVQRLSDSPHGSCLSETSKQGFVEQKVPPVFPANIPSALFGGSEEDDTASKQALGVARNNNVLRTGKDKKKPSVIQTRDSEQKGQDVLISRYAADGRGAIVAAMKQRSNSGPVRREVKVQLLDAGPSSREPLQSPEVQQPSPAFSAGDGVAATAVAAITAATMAATAPIIQAQTAMVARVDRVASELRQLQEAAGGGTDRGPVRAAQLEEDLTTLTLQRLRHLEKVQDQQLQLQNRLLGSALDAVAARGGPPWPTVRGAGEGVTVPESANGPGLRTLPAGDSPAAAAVQSHSKRTQTGWVKSPLETPAPRKVIPKPTHWIPTSQNTQQSNQTHKGIQESYGDGRPLDWIPISQRSHTRNPAHTAGARGVAMATVDDTEPKQFREDPPKASVSPAGQGRTVSTLIKPPGRQETVGFLRDVPLVSHGAGEGSCSSVQQGLRLEEETRNLIRTSELGDVVRPSVVPPSRTSMLQIPPPPTSMFEDAGCVLRQVRQGRKVLEENLQAILRANDGEVLHTQLEALAANRDAGEELRVKKTVDAWISTLSKEIEEELEQLGSAVERVRAPAERPAPRVQGRGGGAGTSKGGARPGRAGPEGKGAAVRRRPSEREPATSRHPPVQRGASPVRCGAERCTQTATPAKCDDDEAYLAKVYGRALYDGHRRTLKKGPYLRFSSPTPRTRAQRPKLIESVKGVKMKSSKTQTSMSGVGTVSSLLRPTPSEPQYLFSPSSPAQEQLAPGSPLRGFLIPMAIPLGQPRVDGQVPVPSRVILSDKPAVVTTSVHRAPGPAPKPAPPIDKPNTVLLEVRSEPKRPAPQLQIQIQPSVNIDGVKVAGSAPSPPVLPAPPIQAGARARTCPDKAQQEDQQEHQQEDGFPGSRFLGVADVSQEPELETECLGSPIELNGLPSAPAALYHGPAFPLQPAPPTLHPEQGLGTTQNTLTLEDKLVDWVEQQLMARVISGMFPPPDPTNQSEPAESVTSDIAEAAGGDGPFAHAGVPVDSELVRQCVNEVLAEIIAATLHQRQRPGEQDTHTGETAVPTSVPTPVPTPEPSVKERPALKEAPSPVSTPTLSEQPSPAQSPRGSHPPTPQKPASPDLEKAPVDTPTSTPAPSPRRSATPSPTPELQSLRNHPWGEVELPLKEEDPHSEEEELGPQPIVLTVAREEEVDAVIPPPFPDPPKPQRPPSVFKEPPPAPPESLSENGSSSRSSPTLTETEAAARHISEGELLLSSGQMAVIRALEEEGVAPPNPMMSFNSSLHGVQDMDYDPPSEGQVVRRPLVPAHHDPVLSLLARMEQGPASQSQQPQGCWDEESSGEVSEGQRPLLTTLQQRVVTGHSLLPQEPTGQASLEQSPHATLSSPGQLHSQFTGWEGAPAEGAGLSVIVKTTEEPTQTPDALLFTPPPPPQTDHATHQQEPECPRPRPRPALILVKQSQALPESGAEMSLQASGSGWPISITLPSVQPNDRSPSNQSPSNQSPSISTIEGDSCSASDVF